MQIFKTKIEKTKDMLKQSTARQVRHVHGSLYDHLCRVSDILITWGCDEDTVLAGLCHSVYSTEYFKTEMIDINSDKVKNIIGEKADKIVREFKIMNRWSMSETSSPLIHIALANDLDHVDQRSLYVKGDFIHEFNKYANVYKSLKDKAKAELFKIISEAELNNLSRSVTTTTTDILFTGHAGVCIRNDKLSIAIDPWLYASTRAIPMIEGLHPDQHTVDYMLPESRNVPSDIAPDIVCISHFHTHHSPLKEIIEFLKIKPIKIICPTMNDEALSQIKKKIGDYMYSRITFKFLDKDIIINEKVNGEEIEIRTFIHHAESGSQPHFMYYIKLGDKSLFHTVDSTANKSASQIDFDPQWDRLKGFDIDYLFVGGVGHAIRFVLNGVRHIRDCASLTPVQAAYLAVRLGARHAGLIGMYNHSVWDDRAEMGLATGEAEMRFHWALSWLAPGIKVLYLRPGDIL